MALTLQDPGTAHPEERWAGGRGAGGVVTARTDAKVALVAAPILSGRDPSFQLALLKPTLERHGARVQCFSLYMYFARFLGWRLHEAIAEVWPSLVGEWMFAKAAFDYDGDPDGYFATYEDNMRQVCELGGCTPDDLRRARDTVVPAFLDYAVDSVDWSRFNLVGLSVVFQQLNGTLAFVRQLKRKYPDLPVVLGGPTFEDDIADEVMRHVPEVDYIHCGDGDVTFPELVRRLRAKESLDGLPGVLRRDGERQVFAGRAPNFAAMNETPVPDFDEYFYARKESGYEGSGQEKKLWLPIESARGCWWGMKNHCTFCGLNRAGMEFRSKPAAQVLDMLATLSARYGKVDFNAIDNILEPAYIDELFGELAAARADFHMHYEVRANLSRKQLRAMRQGGLFSVQAGVESLSTHVLRLMKKNITGIRNLEFMKWCAYYGIINVYNLLAGFAGETAADYAEQAALVPLILHLEPPYAAARARADRGSPMFDQREVQRVLNLRPTACYQFIYPPRVDRARLAYYFDHDSDALAGQAAYDVLFQRVWAWQERWKRGNVPYLRQRNLLGSIVLEDGRGETPVRHTYVGAQARLYEALHDALRPDELRALGPEFAEPWVDEALAEMTASGTMIHLDGKYLSLALPVNPGY